MSDSRITRFVVGVRAWMVLAPGSRPRRYLSGFFHEFKSFVKRNAWLRRPVLFVWYRSPRLQRFVRALLGGGAMVRARGTKGANTFEALSPWARHVYAQIDFARKKFRTDGAD